jgi:twitching motility two-component system response regulator PilG
MSNLIAIIDDSQTVQKIIEACLTRESYQVITFNDGITALRYFLKEHQVQIPDLVFLDIELPYMDGYQVVRYLKARPTLAHTIIVMISRHNGIADRLKAKLAGADSYLIKPMPTQAILGIVHQHLDTLSLEFPDTISNSSLAHQR